MKNKLSILCAAGLILLSAGCVNPEKTFSYRDLSFNYDSSVYVLEDVRSDDGGCSFTMRDLKRPGVAGYYIIENVSALPASPQQACEEAAFALLEDLSRDGSRQIYSDRLEKNITADYPVQYSCSLFVQGDGQGDSWKYYLRAYFLGDHFIRVRTESPAEYGTATLIHRFNLQRQQ